MGSFDNFWDNPSVEPKRNFRFLVQISNFDNVQWLVKTVDKPKFELSSVPHQYINHTFNYPGRVTWQPINLTLVDPVSPTDATATVMSFVRLAGYDIPHGTADVAANSAASNITKGFAVGALGDVKISQLGVPANFDPSEPPMQRIVDQWRLVNAFVQGTVDFGTLDYGNEELTTVSMTLQYDFAYMTKAGGESNGIAEIIAKSAGLGAFAGEVGFAANIIDGGGNSN
jgi:hypothetical protein